MQMKLYHFLNTYNFWNIAWKCLFLTEIQVFCKKFQIDELQKKCWKMLVRAFASKNAS